MLFYECNIFYKMQEILQVWEEKWEKVMEDLLEENNKLSSKIELFSRSLEEWKEKIIVASMGGIRNIDKMGKLPN